MQHLNQVSIDEIKYPFYFIMLLYIHFFPICTRVSSKTCYIGLRGLSFDAACSRVINVFFTVRSQSNRSKNYSSSNPRYLLSLGVASENEKFEMKLCFNLILIVKTKKKTSSSSFFFPVYKTNVLLMSTFKSLFDFDQLTYGKYKVKLLVFRKV